MPRKKVPTGPCNTPGCDKASVKSFPFCKEHMHRSHSCAFEGCTRPIAAYNKSGLCYDHRWVRYKMARFDKAEAREKARNG